MKAKDFLRESANVKVSDPNVKQYLTAASDIIGDALGINSSVINVVIGQSLPNMGQHGLTLPDPKGSGKIMIVLGEGLSAAELLRALAHEMIHAKQILDGDLQFDFGDNISVKYKGKPVPLKYNRSAPWETEAHSKEKDLARMVIDKIGNIQS